LVICNQGKLVGIKAKSKGRGHAVHFTYTHFTHSKVIRRLAVYLILTSSLLGCAQSEAKPLSKGERLLSIDLTWAANSDFGEAFFLGKSLGMQVTNLSVQWDELEPSPGQYSSPDDLLQNANSFFPTQDIVVSLMVGFIDTNNLRLPSDLVGKPVDDPEVIERFKRLLDYVFAEIPDLGLTSLSIGNEIDGYLATDKELWQQYTRFFQAVSAYAKTKRPGLVVGSKLGFGGLMGEAQNLSADLIRSSDAVMLTYYPLEADFTVKNPEVVFDDFAKLVQAFPDKPIYILELGYPSSPLLNSSEEKQAQFVQNVFRAWDKGAAHIKLIDFLWLHDISPEVVNELGTYYKLDNQNFLEYLATLGLRTHQGQSKQAFEVLKQEAKQRGW
jgi:hypothetical protein